MTGSRNEGNAAAHAPRPPRTMPRERISRSKSKACPWDQNTTSCSSPVYTLLWEGGGYLYFRILTMNNYKNYMTLTLTLTHAYPIGVHQCSDHWQHRRLGIELTKQTCQQYWYAHATPCHSFNYATGCTGTQLYCCHDIHVS